MTNDTSHVPHNKTYIFIHTFSECSYLMNEIMSNCQAVKIIDLITLSLKMSTESIPERAGFIILSIYCYGDSYYEK